MLKAAIIGCGAIAQVHKKVLLSLPEAKLIACCDTRAERAEEFAASCGIHPYSSVEALLDGENLDVVHLCVPHPLHTPLASLCVKRGHPRVYGEASCDKRGAVGGIFGFGKGDSQSWHLLPEPVQSFCAEGVRRFGAEYIVGGNPTW